MNLGSGLDLLKGLKELKVVVYVKGEKERAWFKEKWPHATIITTA